METLSEIICCIGSWLWDSIAVNFILLIVRSILFGIKELAKFTVVLVALYSAMVATYYMIDRYVLSGYLTNQICEALRSVRVKTPNTSMKDIFSAYRPQKKRCGMPISDPDIDTETDTESEYDY